jgi:lipid-binding SYLF domain-containing protein
MRRPLAALATCLLIIVTVVPAALAGQVEDDRAGDAARVMGEIMRIPEGSIPDKLLLDAQAIAVIPNVLKAGFAVGGRRGRGLISVRSKDGTWSNPSFITLTGGSFGFQAGVQSTDVILVFRTTRGVNNIVSGKFTLGADASVAAGPVGRSAQASTDEHLKAEILSYSRARGLFAGVALDGTHLGIDNKSNQRVYGDGNTARAIFEGRAGNGSAATIAFRDKLEESTVPQKVAAPAQ